jgi:hypothetical protein
MSIQICTPVLSLPSFESYLSQLRGLKLQFDPSALQFPTMPSPLFPNFISPDIFIAKLASQFSTMTFLNFIKAALSPMMKFLGMVVQFPAVPILNLTLDDLINGFDMNALINNLYSTLLNLRIPLLPDPLLPAIDFPQYNILEKVHALINAYCGNLLTFATSIISSVIDKLGKKPFNFIVNFPGIPAFPTTFEELMAPIFAFLGAANLEEFIAKFKLGNIPSLSSLFMSIKFPGFLAMNLVLPDPLFESLSFPQIEIAEMAKNYYNAIMNAAANIIKQFCDAVSNFISFAFPTVCFTIPTL